MYNLCTLQEYMYSVDKPEELEEGPEMKLGSFFPKKGGPGTGVKMEPFWH